MKCKLGVGRLAVNDFVVIAPLHDPVARYKITHAGMQIAHWDFQDKG